jgi:hypothetical protein
MPVVQTGFDGLRWPSCCCSCGARDFKWRSHSERVVIWTVLSVTKYREITLQMPACDDCMRRPWYWFGAASVVIGLAVLHAMRALDRHQDVGVGFVMVIAVGIGLVLKGLAAKPLKILGFDSDDRTVKLKFRSEDVARQLRTIRRGSGR